MDEEVETVAAAIAQVHLNFAEAASHYCGFSPDRLSPIVDLVASKLGEPTWINDEQLPLSDALFEAGGPLKGSESLAQGSPLWNRTFLFMPLVGKLVRRSGPESAYQILDAENLDRLEKQTDLLRTLLKYEHFLTVEELATRATSFAKFLAQNRDPLLRTGYPAASFTAWPAPLAVNLYPVRVPANLFHTPRQHAQEDSFVVDRPRLVWCCSGTHIVICADQRCPPGMVECRYELAQFRADVEAGSAMRLEDSRQVLLDLKMHLVERAALALQRGSAVGLWDDCLKLLTDALLGHDADFYLQIDQQWGFGLRETGRLSQINLVEMMPGGLTEVLELIGYCEKELTLGTMSRTKAALELLLDIEESDVDIGFLLSARRTDIDAALDLFRLLNRQEASFWQGFQERINLALRNDFAEEVEVMVRARVKRPHAARFAPHLEFLASWSRDTLEQTGALPVFQSLPLTPVSPNRFRREGKIWTLAYQGQDAHVQDIKGLEYLAYLLKNPGRSIHVQELVRQIEGSPSPRDTVQTVSKDALLDDIGASSEGFGDAGWLSDPQAQRELKTRLQELEDEIADAEAMDNWDAAENLKGEKDQIIRYLTAAFGRKGRPRKAVSADEKARTSVQKAINRALEEIGKVHLPLREHLAAIDTGFFCTYQPPGNKPPDWEF